MTKNERQRRELLIGRLNLQFEGLKLIDRLHRLASTYHRMAENDCNGEGTVNGRFYRMDNGSAYLADGSTSVFTAKADGIEKLIRKLIPANWSVDFQGDPRGYEIKLKINDHDVSDLLYL